MKRLLACATLFALTLTGCWEVLSWSPDGRYLAIVNPPGTEPWRWDTKSQTASPLGGGPAMQVTYLDTNDRLLYAYELEDDSDYWKLVYRDHRNGITREIVPRTHPYGYAIAHDAKAAYAVEQEGEDGTWILVERTFDNPDLARELYRASGDILVAGGTAKQGILITEAMDGDSWRIARLDPANPAAGPETLVTSEGRELWLAAWIDDRRFAYTKEHPENDDLGRLAVHSLETGRSRTLHDGVMPFLRPAVAKDGAHIIVTGVRNPRGRAYTGEMPLSIQLLSVNIDSGTVEELTREDLGAGYGAYNARTNSVAYLSPPDFDSEAVTVRILDMDTGETTIAWNNDDSRKFAEAEHLFQDGRSGLAREAYRDIVKDESEFSELARYRLANLAMGDQDIDSTFDLIRSLSGKWRNQADAQFWLNEFIVATDTDAPRPRLAGPQPEPADDPPPLDFDTLSLRASEDSLYLRLTVHSPDDRPAPVLQHLWIAINRDNTPARTIELAPGMAREIPASALVRINRWDSDHALGPREVEILDRNGASTARLNSNGFAPAPDGPFDMSGPHRIDSMRVAFDLSLSRATLDLRGHHTGEIQVFAVDPANAESPIIDIFGEAAKGSSAIGGSPAKFQLN